MKRKQFLQLSAAAPLGLVGASTARGEDPPAPSRVRKGTAADLRELESSKEVSFNLKAMVPSGTWQSATRVSEGISALMLKVLLNRKEPQAYPLSRDPSSLERRVAAAMKPIIEGKKPRWEKILQDPARMKSKLGRLIGVDLKAELTTAAMGLSAEVAKKGPPPYANINDSRLNLDAYRLHCLDETNPESSSDRLILGGALVGEDGTLAPLNSLYCGEFDDGDVTNLGPATMGWTYLKKATGYPKRLYAILQLIKIDGDESETVSEVDMAIRSMIAIVNENFSSPNREYMGSMLYNVIETTLGSYISGNLFPLCCIPVDMSGYGAATGPFELVTITGLDGIYRFGHKWRVTHPS